MPSALVMPPGTGPSAGPGGGLHASHLPRGLMASPELPTTAAGPDPTVWGIVSVVGRKRHVLGRSLRPSHHRLILTLCRPLGSPMGTGTGSPHALRPSRRVGHGGNMSQAERSSWRGLHLLNQGGEIPHRPPSLPGEANTHTWGVPLLGGEFRQEPLARRDRLLHKTSLPSALPPPAARAEPICLGSQTGAEPAAGRVPG